MSSATPVVQAMAELDLPHEQVSVDLTTGAQRRPEFLALNPNGKVPTLLVDGSPMFEAVAIMKWLGDRFGVERGLWPAAGTPEHLEALSWSTWAYVTFGAPLHSYIYASSDRVPAEYHSRVTADRAAADLQALLQVLDAKVAARPYILGDAYSLADLIVSGSVGYGTICGVSIEDHPHVQAWLARCHERESFKKVWAGATA